MAPGITLAELHARHPGHSEKQPLLCILSSLHTFLQLDLPQHFPLLDITDSHTLPRFYTHIILLAQCFVTLYMHTDFWTIPQTCHEYPEPADAPDQPRASFTAA